MDVTLRNTADHHLLPGDPVTTVTLNGEDWRVVRVEPVAHEPLLLSYGLTLIPLMVVVTLEKADK